MFHVWHETHGANRAIEEATQANWDFMVLPEVILEMLLRDDQVRKKGNIELSLQSIRNKTDAALRRFIALQENVSFGDLSDSKIAQVKVWHVIIKSC